MNANRVDSGAVKGFVRETLGCACPDEVFDHIEASGPSADALAQIAIGGRLLIRCHAATTGGDVTSCLPRWLASGIAARDSLGCNRLRLLLAVPDPAAIETQAQRLLVLSRLPDERIHVHLLGEAQAAKFLAAVGGAGWP